MSIDVDSLEEAEWAQYVHGSWTMRTFYAEAHGVMIDYRTTDLDLRLWVSSIWNMRQKGVALVDSTGAMVKCERRDR